MSTIADFANSNTWLTLTEKAGPPLYEAARWEFETIIGGGDVQEEDLREIEAQGELIKKLTCAYIDGLVKMFQEYARSFYGNESETCSDLGGSGDHCGNGGEVDADGLLDSSPN